MIEPVFGIRYHVWIDGEPVPKSTQPPPVIRKSMSGNQRAYAVQAIINNNAYYAPLKKTQAYQKYVADCIVYLPPPFPQFHKLDPIKLTLNFHKSQHATGDLKNLIAGIEDGIQHSGRIPNDRQITTHGPKQIWYYSTKPGVEIIAEITPIAADFDWLYGWFKQNRKQTEKYIAMRGIEGAWSGNG